MNWKPVVGWEGIYSISSDGQVRRDLPGKRTRPGNILAPRGISSGYLSVRLYQMGRKQTKTVHAMVAEAFIGPRPDGHDVCHIDGDRLNNCVSNLRYGSRSQNITDQVGHGTHRNARKTHCMRGHEFDPENTYIDGKGKRYCRTCRRLREAA